MNRLDEKTFEVDLAPTLESGDRCLLYGAGSIGAEMFRVLNSAGIEPLAFLDSRKSGLLEGLPIYTPDTVPEELKDFPVLITIFSSPPPCSLTNIISFLNKQRFRRIISFESFYCRFHRFFERSHYWLDDPNHVRGHEKEIASVYEILADDTSRELFQKQIRFRMNGDASFLLPPSPVPLQYFDPSVYSRQTFREFWDLGAFTGDTLANAAFCGKKFKHVKAFEPDMKNYALCCHYLEQHKQDYESAVALPLAVGERLETLNFTANASSSASVSGEGDTTIPSVAMDSAFIGASPDFIKMDIEGSELAALKGMRNILLKNRPLLTVCIYHRPDDLWSIPLFLRDLLDGYSFYIRCYGEHLFETVLYGVPLDF